jgi:hypothetical protein
MRSFVDNLADVKRMMANFAGVRLSTALTATLQWISDCLCSGGGALTRTLLPLAFIKLWQQFVWRNSSRITIIPQNIILIHGSNSRREVRCGRTDVNSSICAMGWREIPSGADVSVMAFGAAKKPGNRSDGFGGGWF